MRQRDFTRLGWLSCPGSAKLCAHTYAAADSVRRYPFWLIGMLLYICICHPTAAQIRADNTLPENSTVTRQGNTSVIRQGTRRGRNLFHSFERFSIPRNQSAVFQDLPSEVENIFARVTGSDRSLINGLLEAQQTGGNLSPANFFLLNPNGIIFGENASLNIGGSFIASTAERIQFADGFQFSAVNPQVQPLLSVQVPVGLQLGPTPGAISNQATASLSVRPGRTIALIGGPITLVGGGLTAEAGRIELVAASSGNVGLFPSAQGWQFDLAKIQTWQDINLAGASLSARGAQGGSIQIQGRQIRFTDGSIVNNSALASGQAGDLRVVGTDVELVGTSLAEDNRVLQNQVAQQASGEAGSLSVETRRLIVRDGAQISSRTQGEGQGVPLTIVASESVELIGAAFDLTDNRWVPSGLFARSGGRATGNGGTLTVTTNRLSIQNGAQISTDTFGAGDAGNLVVNASDIVEVIGRNPDDLKNASGIFAQVSRNASGNGGSLKIQTPQLLVQGGAQISSNTLGAGQAGTIDIDASDSVLLSGTAPINRDDNISGILVSAEPGATGNANQLNLTTPSLTIEAGARISADNFGTGNRGGIARLNVENLQLNQGEIKATTASGRGGIIELTDTESLLMQNGSQITALAAADASGGNIVIDAAEGVILASNQNNDITANADRGRGGNIRIDAQGILGLAERRQTALTNDIDASSESGTPGTVTINSVELNPSATLPELPSTPIRSELAQGCQLEGRPATAAFFSTGHGGLALSPYEPLSNSDILADLRLPNSSQSNQSSLIEAQGWIRSNRGEVELVAEQPNGREPCMMRALNRSHPRLGVQ